MASFTYFEDSDGAGDFYYAKEATLAAQSPATHPLKWQRLEIPARFEEVLVKRAALALLPIEDEVEKVLALRGEVRREMDILKTQAARERQRATLPVKVRG